MASAKPSKRRRSNGSYRYLENTFDHNQPLFRMVLKLGDALRRLEEISTLSPAVRAVGNALNAIIRAFFRCLSAVLGPKVTAEFFRYLFGLSKPKVSTSPPKGWRRPQAQ